MSFAFDSLLKIDLLGVRMHVGLIFILLILGIEFVAHPTSIGRMKAFIRTNWSILPFFGYLFLQFILNKAFPGAIMLLLYYFLALISFYYFFKKHSSISKQSVIMFQWIMVTTGLFQFLLFKIFGFQLSFYEVEHYMVDASFATRMRGFFVEPNWYSIVFSFNTLLLAMILKRKILEYKVLILLSFVCFYFNASYTSIAIVVLVLLIQAPQNIRYISKTKLITTFSLVLIIALVFAGRVYDKRKSSNQIVDASTAVNYGSRFFPVVRTYDFMTRQSSVKQFFGFGLGSWPYVGIEENRLGYIGVHVTNKVEPGKRDSAEIQVFMLEFGFLSFIFLFFDYFYNYMKYRKHNLFYAIACVFLASCFFIYPIFKFMMYIVPFYLMRSIVTERNEIIDKT
ncbi:hypothetical protein [Alkalitalea saponilacus]|nr:hypothetical protein [Alkalitalea saponilacus]